MLEKRSADDIFRAADVNSDGQLSFEEFLKWYNETANKSKPRRTDRSGVGEAVAPYRESQSRAISP